MTTTIYKIHTITGYALIRLIFLLFVLLNLSLVTWFLVFCIKGGYTLWAILFGIMLLSNLGWGIIVFIAKEDS
jgi:hypothetical protein